MKQIKTVMVGLGSVHQNLLQILVDKKDRLNNDYDVEFIIVSVADSSGAAYSATGFDPLTLIEHKKAGKSVADLAGVEQTTSIMDLVTPKGCDLVFEASPVDLKTGGIGLEVTRKALNAGISVVLANKGPMVLAFDELAKLAEKKKAGLHYSATVCGGLPVLNIGRRDMMAGEILKLQGIFNSTSNFILDGMAEGRTFDASLREAQDRGIAEADPSLDISGWDTANKLLIIANTIMGAGISLDDISVEGIEGVDEGFVIEEQKRGNVVKLLAKAEKGVFSVSPTVMSKDEFLGSCNGWEMAVEIQSDIYGLSYYKLWEREPIPTAASMLRDALTIYV